MNDGSCRTGYCFYVSEQVVLNIQVKDPTTYSYLLPVVLSPGFNLLSWCKESILAQGTYGGPSSTGKQTKIPEFSLMLCCNGMALTYRPVDPSDPTSPYVASSGLLPQSYRLRDYVYPPSLTVLSGAGSVPSLQLLARVAGGGGGTHV